MNVAIVHTLNQTLLKKIEAKKISTVIYTAIDPSLQKSHLHLNLINIFDNFANVSDFCFNYNKHKLNAIQKTLPGLFEYMGHNLLQAIEKDLFFSRLQINAVEYHIEKLRKPGTRFFNYYNRKKHIKLVALFKRLFLGNNNLYKFDLPLSTQTLSPEHIAFRINTVDLVELYGDLIPKLKNHSILSFQNSEIEEEGIDQALLNFFQTNIKSITRPTKKNKISLLNRIRIFFTPIDNDFLNAMVDNLFKLINHVEQYDRLMKYGVRKLFLGGAENEGEGNVVCSVAKKYNGITYNYMNGAKAKDQHNVNTNFDYWFMPNHITKDLILSFCNVVGEQLPVTGHLLEEKAQNYNYSGSLDYLGNQILEKKIICVFTSFYVREQSDVLNFLSKFINHNEDCIVLVRKHPSDSGKEKIIHPGIIYLNRIELGTPFQNLFDLLSISDITISFSSTISLQSSWFKIPTLNFEYADVSMLPYVDDNRIMHVNSLDKLNELIKKYLANKTFLEMNQPFFRASDNIIKILEKSEV